MIRIRKSRAPWIITTLLLLVLACCVVLYIVGVSIYDGVFQVRFETDPLTAFSVEEFEGLAVEEMSFLSNNGQRLAAYKYTSDGVEPRGIVVFAHGFGGGGQVGYMNIFDRLCRGGYAVFAYDATGNDRSEGEVIGGFPQGVIDLDYAIRYVKAAEWRGELPITLMGYSWGSYCVNSVLAYHPDVEAVVSVSGFNSSMDLIEYEGVNMVGWPAYTMLPFAKLDEIFTYGKYATGTAISGFESTDAAVMILHSRDDTTVPVRYGYDKYFEKYGEDGRFTFVSYEDRGHNNIFLSPEYVAYRAAYRQALNEYESELGRDMTAEEERAYYETNFDRGAYVNSLDEALFSQILSFLDASTASEGLR